MRSIAIMTACLAWAVVPAAAQDAHAGHMAEQTPAAQSGPRNPSLPPDAAAAPGQLKTSPRHGEWVDIKGADAPLKSFVVYPERSDKAPVVIVIHEIFGMSDWVRGVADQLAKEGFIAIAPDLLSGKGPNGGGTDSLGDKVGETIRTLTPDDVASRLNAVLAYGKSLPSSNGKTGVIGFCWGGSQTFGYVVAQPALGAAVPYYGTPPMKMEDGTRVPDPAALAKIQAPVLAFYGGADNRVTSTMEPTAAAMKSLGKSFDPHVFDGAGHGFLRQQSGQDGANMKATEEAWPLTIAFFRKHLQ